MTIHRILKGDVAEMNRVLELIQKQIKSVSNVTTQATSSTGTSGSASVAGQGPKGDTGPAGADGIANLDTIVMSRTEEEEIVVTNSGDIVADHNGYAVTGIKESWSMVTDNSGNIVTTE